jgi:MFS family permease
MSTELAREPESEPASAPPRPWRALLGRYFARRVVYPWERPGIMRKHIYTGAMGSIWGSLIAGLFFFHFGTSIGLTELHWGILAAGSAWLSTAQLVSAHITQRTGRRKALWFWFAITDRSLRLTGMLVAFWLWRAGWPYAAIIFIVAINVSDLFNSMTSPPWLSWLADIIPSEEHGTFWGRRSAWIAVATVVVIIAAAVLADHVSEQHKLQVIIGLFVLATIIGLADLLIHGTIPEPQMVLPERNHFWRQVLEPLRDRAFRPWLTFNAAWTFSMTLGGALAALYFLNELKFKNDFVGGVIVVSCIPLLGTMISGKWSGRLVDRFGTRPVLFWGHMAWALFPLFWLAATPQTARVMVAIAGAIAGVSCTAASTAANKLVVRVPPPGRCPIYTAVSTTLSCVVGGFAVLGAGAMLKALRGWSITIAGWPFGAFHLLFAVSFALRLLCTVAFVPRLDKHPPYPRAAGAVEPPVPTS